MGCVCQGVVDVSSHPSGFPRGATTQSLHGTFQLRHIAGRISVVGIMRTEKFTRETEACAIDKLSGSTFEVLFERGSNPQEYQVQHVSPVLRMWRSLESGFQLSVEPLYQPISDWVV